VIPRAVTSAAPRRCSDWRRTASLIVDRRYANADFQDFSRRARALPSPKRRPSRKSARGGCGLAGPIADDGASARLTNLPWTIDVAAAVARASACPPCAW
jgi:glucokinase